MATLLQTISLSMLCVYCRQPYVNTLYGNSSIYTCLQSGIAHLFQGDARKEIKEWVNRRRSPSHDKYLEDAVCYQCARCPNIICSLDVMSGAYVRINDSSIYRCGWWVLIVSRTCYLWRRLSHDIKALVMVKFFETV